MTRNFYIFVGGLAVLLVAIWMGSYDGGFGWAESPEQQFHYHPMFMVIGLIFLYGEGKTDKMWYLF